MKKLRRGACLLMALLCALALWPVRAAAVELPITSRAALLMEKSTGQILYARNEHEQLEPASVTKVMTLLLTMEAIDSGTIHYDDVVTVSADAAGMGGSQVFLAEGEQITVEELLKAVCVASGNDAAVALAEKVAGVHELFVEQMNRRAAELGMADTTFINCTGLPAAGHLTSAYDIALMCRQLILDHPAVREFTTIWMDSFRDGTFASEEQVRMCKEVFEQNGIHVSGGITTAMPDPEGAEPKQRMFGTLCYNDETMIRQLEEKYKDKGRLVIRASGTEPRVRVMIEGPDQREMDRDVYTLSKLIEKELN